MIRKATKKDTPVLMLLIHGLFENSNNLDKDEELSSKRLKNSLKYMKDYLTKRDNTYFLANDKEIPTGYVHTNIDKLKSGKKQGYISELFVLKAFRGRKIGQRLIKEQEKWLKQNKVKEVIVSTEKNNHKTLKFYKGLKYVEYKNHEDKRKNLVYLRKKL
jgi:diamine N-acetyltransferase